MEDILSFFMRISLARNKVDVFFAVLEAYYVQNYFKEEAVAEHLIKEHHNDVMISSEWRANDVHNSDQRTH